MSTSPQSLDVSLDRRESVSSELTRKLVDHLVRDGHLRPGDRLPSERQLADTLGIGRSAVREALKSLAFLGLIEVRQGAGSYVKEPDSELLPQVIEWGLLLGERKVLDLVEARRLIEVAVAPLAAQRRDESDLEMIEHHLTKMSKARNTADFVEADIAFHLALADAAGNSIFSDILSSVQALLRVWITRVIDAAESTEPTHQEHLAVFGAVGAKDAKGARVAMQRHMDRASSALLLTLEQTEANATKTLRPERS
ncbi:MAG TPA: FadR family transcriptional regulator [Actinobacteria bacterium]|nr:FadR family transcriptional regulator [Actinomycetota bacterium]